MATKTVTWFIFHCATALCKQLSFIFRRKIGPDSNFHLLPLLFCTTIFAVVRFAACEVRFDVSPTDAYAVEQECVHLKCAIYPAEGGTNYEWFKDGNLVDKSRERYQRHRSDLVIRRFQSDLDSGEYVCTVKLESGARFASPPAILQLLHYTNATIELLKRDDNDVELLCKVENVGPRVKSTIKWYRNHEEVVSGDEFEVENTRLTIRLDDMFDNLGRFQCVAHGKPGMIVSAPIEFQGRDYSVINVPRRHHKKRSKDEGNRQVLVKEYEQLVLSCEHSEIDSHMTVLWTKDGSIYRSSSVHGARLGDMHLDFNNDISLFREDTRIFISKVNGSLIINRLSVPDEGLYGCQLFNNETSELIKKDQLYAVKVEQMLKFIPKPVSKKLELGGPGKLHCKVQGTPPPKVEWFRNVDEPLGTIADDLNGTLYFKEVASEIQGNYTCLASNVQGTISATIQVQVVMSPKFIVAPLGIVEVEHNKSVMLDCQAIGDPPPTIQWDKDLKYLNLNSSDTDGRYKFYENGSLFISDLQDGDEGMYGCTIGNSGGLKREEVNVVIKNADSSEMNLTITKAVILTMSLAATYIILVIGLIMWFRVRRRKRKSAQLAENGNVGEGQDEDGNNGNESQPCVAQDTVESTTSPAAGKAEGCVTNNVKAAVFSVNNFLIERSCLAELVQVGRGEFGNVLLCKIPVKEIRASRSRDVGKGEKSGSVEDLIVQDTKPALVIMLSKAKDSEQERFNQRMEMFGSVQHRNVCRLYGVSNEQVPIYMILEYTDWGDLKQFLLATAKQSESEQEAVPPLSISQILSLAHQVSRGMDAITKLGFFHNDLATRNCVITSQLVVKISCPALSKDKYKEEYFKVDNHALPIRWMSPDSVENHSPSLKSDVFSYGVFVWEIFNQAKLPHETLSNDQVLKALKENSLPDLQQNNDCPDTLKDLFAKCCSKEPQERPTFAQISSSIIAQLKSQQD